MGRGVPLLEVPGEILKYVDFFLVVLYYDLGLSRVYWDLNHISSFTIRKAC